MSDISLTTCCKEARKPQQDTLALCFCWQCKAGCCRSPRQKIKCWSRNYAEGNVISVFTAHVEFSATFKTVGAVIGQADDNILQG